MAAPTKSDTPGWKLNRYVASAGCLFTLVVFPTSIGGEIDSLTGPDGQRIFSDIRSLSVAPPSSPPLPEPGGPPTTRRRRQPSAGFGPLIDRFARKHGINPELVRAAAKVESNYNPTATSPGGALGVMQFLPPTSARFGVADACDPAQNFEGGVGYFTFLRDQIPGNLFSVAPVNPHGRGWPRRHRQSLVLGEIVKLYPVPRHLIVLREKTLARYPASVPMFSTTIDTPGWKLNRYVASAGCLFTLVVCPASIGGEIDSFTGPDGHRIFSNTGNFALAQSGSPTLPEPGARLRIRRRGQPPAGIGRLIHRFARKHGMDPELVKAVARVESNYNPTAISPKGARGVMQLLPATAERFGVADAYDPAQNIEGGIRYLKFLRDQFPGNLSLVLAAYNAGENAVRRHGGIPPYPETRDYVQKIRQLYGRDLPDPSAGGVRPSIVSYRDSAGRLVYSNLESAYR